MESKTKKIIGMIALIIIGIFLYFFIKNAYKKFEFGNNISNKNIEEIEEYILDISSYEAMVEVTVESNKNTNKYVLLQKYSTPNVSKQVVLEPTNIEGIETIYDGEKLIINNSKLNVTSIYDNYNYIVNNFLWLNSFIEDYKSQKNNNKTKLYENDENIIMETKTNNEENKYIYNKTLYISKKTGKPTKLIVQDINKKNLVYILYNEITVNGLRNEEVLAFKLDKIYGKLF